MENMRIIVPVFKILIATLDSTVINSFIYARLIIISAVSAIKCIGNKLMFLERDEFWFLQKGFEYLKSF